MTSRRAGERDLFDLIRKQRSFSYSRSIVSDRVFYTRAEGVALAFFRGDKFGADAAILIAVEEDERAARTARGFEIRVIHKAFKFGGHGLSDFGFSAGTRFALHSSPAVSLKETFPLIVSPLTLPEYVSVTSLPL